MNFLVRRLLTMIPVIFGVLCLSFFLIHMIPGDPVDIMLGDNAQLLDKQTLKKELGLDQPLSVQFRNYLSKLLQLNLGISLQTRRPVLAEILSRLPATFELAAATLLFSLFVGIPLGVLAALKKDRFIDRSLLILSSLGLSMPSFWLGPVLIWLFALHWNILPISERGQWAHLVLPSLTLSSGLIALILRMTRNSMLEVLKQDFIKVAKAKGLSSYKLYFFHGLTNALFPLLTLAGLILGSLLTGTVIIETLFDWPGIGSLIYQAIQQRDYPMVQGCVIFISLTYVMVNFLTDLSYRWISPKMSFEA